MQTGVNQIVAPSSKFGSVLDLPGFKNLEGLSTTCDNLIYTHADLNKRIICFGDEPASFDAEMTKLNKKIVSITSPV